MCEMGLYSIQLALDPHGAKCLWVEWHLFEGNSIMWGVKIKRSGKLLRLQLTYWVMPRLWPSSSVAWKLWKCRMFLQYVNLLIRTWNRVNYRAGSRESWAEPPELLHQWHSLRFGKQHRAQKGDLGEMAQAHPAPAGANWLSAGADPAWKPWSSKQCWNQLLTAESCEGMTKVDPAHHPGQVLTLLDKHFAEGSFSAIRFLSESCRLHSLEEEKSLQGQTLTQTIVSVWLTVMYFFVWN